MRAQKCSSKAKMGARWPSAAWSASSGDHAPGTRCGRHFEAPRSAGGGGGQRLRAAGNGQRPCWWRVRGHRRSRRCTWWAACCATASPRSGCRATSSTARSSACSDAGIEVPTNKVIGKTFTVVEQLTGAMGFDVVFVAAGAGAPAFLASWASRLARSIRQRVPDPRQPDGRRPLPTATRRSRWPPRRRHRCRQHRDGLPARGRGGWLGASADVRCVHSRSRAEAPARVEELRHAARKASTSASCTRRWRCCWTKTAMRACARRMTLGEPDARGRQPPVPLEGAFVEWPRDTVITRSAPRPTRSSARPRRGWRLDRRG